MWAPFPAQRGICTPACQGRDADILEQRQLAAPERLLAVLTESIGRPFPTATRFGPPVTPGPAEPIVT